MYNLYTFLHNVILTGSEEIKIVMCKLISHGVLVVKGRRKRS